MTNDNTITPAQMAEHLLTKMGFQELSEAENEERLNKEGTIVMLFNKQTAEFTPITIRSAVEWWGGEKNLCFSYLEGTEYLSNVLLGESCWHTYLYRVMIG